MDTQLTLSLFFKWSYFKLFFGPRTVAVLGMFILVNMIHRPRTEMDPTLSPGNRGLKVATLVAAINHFGGVARH